MNSGVFFSTFSRYNRMKLVLCISLSLSLPFYLPSLSSVQPAVSCSYSNAIFNLLSILTLSLFAIRGTRLLLVPLHPKTPFPGLNHIWQGAGLRVFFRKDGGSCSIKEMRQNCAPLVKQKTLFTIPELTRYWKVVLLEPGLRILQFLLTS